MMWFGGGRGRSRGGGNQGGAQVIFLVLGLLASSSRRSPRS
jgi:hypothetical protein